MTPTDRPLFAATESDAAALVKEPQQARSRRTLARILQASLELLEAEGPDALTVTRIAKKARSSVGSFYARFDGKEDLVRYVGEHSLQEASAAWDELLRTPAPSGTSHSCESLVRGLGGILTGGPGLPLVLLDGVEESERARMRRFEDEVATGLRSLAGNDVGARVAAMALTSVLAQAVRDLGEADRRRLMDELVRLVAGYFGSPMPEAAPPEETERDPEPDAEPASPWDEAASELVGTRTAVHEAPSAPKDEVDELEVAFRDLGAELDGPGDQADGSSEAETGVEDDGGASKPETAEDPGVQRDATEADTAEEPAESPPPDADPFDVWG